MPDQSRGRETLVPTFGVRHLSPMGAWQLRRFLEERQPELVLIEGPADAAPLVADLVHPQSRPPVALLAYTQSVPVRTFVYPLATYSPEYQAAAWASRRHLPVEFIDLPSAVTLARQASPSRGAGLPSAEEPSHALSGDTLYVQLAQQVGELDYESYWERNFEHNRVSDAYRLAINEFGAGIRQCEQRDPIRHDETLLREAYMRRRIHQAIRAGYAAEKIVAVVGAFHAPVLTAHEHAMTDDEFKSLPGLESRLTLMPYSYFKLSTQSGYGAGNQAPAYFELLWQTLLEDRLDTLPATFLSLVARHLRTTGTHRSTAEVIEAVRLARALSALRGGTAPTLRDLQDAAVTVIGHGERSTIQESLARIEIGTAIGRLPPGVSQTSIQEDFQRQMSRLKLAKYQQAAKRELALDLRENRRAKTPQTAMLDLQRSGFLHRLQLLEIPFATVQPSSQTSATWSESWHLQWTPEAEIALVESVLLGETVELAAGYKFQTMLKQCDSIATAAHLVRRASECGLIRSMESARQRLQHLAADSDSFVAIAQAAHDLSLVVRYGDVRQFNPQPLLPLIDELFVHGAMGLFAAANGDYAAAREVLGGIDRLDQVCCEHHDRLEEAMWIRQLSLLAESDDRNPVLSGYALAILLERNATSSEQLQREVCRRLSPGIDADLGAGWFEGLARRNRYALLARQALWQQLADYVRSLDDSQFTRALVFLRRAFGHFSPHEKRLIAENLGDVWGLTPEVSSEVIGQPLSEAEQQTIDDLNEFDFDDI